MNETHELIIKQVLTTYGLNHIYKGYTLLNGYVMLNLLGNVSINRLLETPQINQASSRLGLIAELYSGDILNVSTSDRHLIVVSGEDMYAAELVRLHINNAAEEATALIHDPSLEGKTGAALSRTVQELLTEALDYSAARLSYDPDAPLSQRRARARALEYGKGHDDIPSRKASKPKVIQQQLPVLEEDEFIF